MLPQTFISSLKNCIGFDDAAFIATHESKQQLTSVRINENKNLDTINLIQDIKNEFFENEVQLEKVAWCNSGFYLPHRPFFTHSPLIHAGVFYVQEASSMFLQQVLQHVIKENTSKLVLDLCAAPGGKSTLLSNFFKDGLLVSNEVIKQRSHVLVENTTKWGNENLIVTNNSTEYFKPLENFFDVINIDAPCSGSGLFRKDVDAIKEWSIDNVNLCSQRQQKILEDIIPCLKDDGILIYSTCSYSQQENEDIVDWILENNELKSLPIKLDASWGIVETLSKAANGYGYRFYPNKVKGEGFFIAAFKKETSNTRLPKLKETNVVKLNKQDDAFVKSFIKNNEQIFLFNHNQNIKAIPLNWVKHIQILIHYLYIKKAGTEIGLIKGKDLVPSHDFAVSTLEKQNFKKIIINKQQALQYLSKKEVIIDEKQNGFVLLQYQNYSIGWCKILQNRINNYYPTDWRILNTDF